MYQNFLRISRKKVQELKNELQFLGYKANTKFSLISIQTELYFS